MNDPRSLPRPLRVYYYNTFLSSSVAEGMVSRQFYAAATKLERFALVPAIPCRGSGAVDDASAGGRGSGEVGRFPGRSLRHRARNLAAIRALRAPIYTRRRIRRAERTLVEQGPFDVLLLHLSQADLATLAHLGRRVGLPIVVRVPGPFGYQADQVFHRHMSSRERAHEQYLYRRAAAISVISKPMKDLMVEQGVDADRIAVMPNGVDANAFRAERPPDSDRIRRQLGLGDCPVVGYVGGFWPGNDMPTLLRAWRIVEREHADARLLLVGDGPMMGAARELATSLSLQRCLWAGRVPHRDVPDYLAIMTVAVGPYTQEALAFVSPLKVIEYAAMGVPTVAADGGQIGELVEPGVSGYLYPAGSAQRLAAAVGAILRSPGKARSMSRAARLRMQSWPTWEQVAGQILTLCASVSTLPEVHPLRGWSS